VVFDEESMLQDKSDMKDKAQGGALDNSVDTQEKRVEFSENPKRSDGSNKDSSDSNADEQEATQEKHKSLRRSVRVTVPPTMYGWEDDHVSFALVTETSDSSSYREAIKTDDHSKWITVME